MYKFGRNWLSSFGGMEVGNFMIPVNDTLACQASSLFSWLLTHYCVS